MLDNNQLVINKNTVNFNSVGGTLVKSMTKSVITRFHMNSTMAKEFLCDDPFRTKHGRDISIIVLQVMLCGDREFLVEYIDEETTNEDN